MWIKYSDFCSVECLQNNTEKISVARISSQNCIPQRIFAWAEINFLRTSGDH